MLLASLAYTEEDAADKFPKDIAAMEQSLKQLEEQEQKYSAELDAALAEYAGLREQAQGVDPVQLLSLIHIWGFQNGNPCADCVDKAGSLAEMQPCPSAPAGAAIPLGAVSYTHLDVYKRQE